MPDYLQHGRRHGTQGSDPIPGLDGTPMIMANGSGSTLTGSDNFIDLTAYLTTDSDIYGLDVGTGGLSGTHGVSIGQNGVYRAWFRYLFSAATPGDTLVGQYNGGAGPNLLWGMTNTQQLDETRVVYSSGSTGLSVVEFGRLFVVGGSLEPLPVASLPRLVFAETANDTGGGGGSYDVAAWVLVERLGASYETNSSVPF